MFRIITSLVFTTSIGVSGAIAQVDPPTISDIHTPFGDMTQSSSTFPTGNGTVSNTSISTGTGNGFGAYGGSTTYTPDPGRSEPVTSYSAGVAYRFGGDDSSKQSSSPQQQQPEPSPSWSPDTSSDSSPTSGDTDQ